MIIESEVGYLSDVNKQRVKFEGEDIDFYIDPSDFSLIVRNLLRNACNYSDKEVLISLQQTDNLVELTIEDFGRGISIADQKRVFDRFYRVDKGRSRQLGGTGIGLSLVKHAAERNDGDIYLESQLGEGSKFFVKFNKE